MIIIDRGRIAAQGTPEELARQVLGSEFLRLVLSGTGGGTEELLAEVEGVVGIERDPDHPPGAEESAFRLRIERGRDPRAELSRLAREKSWTILELRPPGLTLEEVFLHVTSRDQPPGLDPTPPTGALS